MRSGNRVKAMNCPTCGQDNPTEARFCSNCGSELIAPAGSTAVPPFKTEPSRLPTRDLGDLVGETFRVYGRSFWFFVLIAFVPAMPLLVSNLTSGSVSVILFMAGFFLGILAQGATVHGVVQQYLGRQISVGEAFGRAWRRVVALILAFIVFGLALLGSGILVLIIIGIPLFYYLLVSWFFYPQAIMLEDKGPLAALGRSRELVRGSWWRVFVMGIIFVLMIVVLFLVALIPESILTSVVNPTAGTLFITAVQILLSPIIPIGATQVYIYLRVRKEDYTLEVIASEVGR